jgi:hypothetical protein
MRTVAIRDFQFVGEENYFDVLKIDTSNGIYFFDMNEESENYGNCYKCYPTIYDQPITNHKIIIMILKSLEEYNLTLKDKKLKNMVDTFLDIQHEILKEFNEDETEDNVDYESATLYYLFSKFLNTFSFTIFYLFVVAKIFSIPVSNNTVTQIVLLYLLYYFFIIEGKTKVSKTYVEQLPIIKKEITETVKLLMVIIILTISVNIEIIRNYFLQ